MTKYMNTALWKKCFELESEDLSSQQMLKQCYVEMRKKAEMLVNLIVKDIPSLTVHDVSHLDALWENASLISGGGFEINPIEGFVLGGAILLHDAAMSLAAFPNGMQEIKKTPQWLDALASIDEEVELSEKEIEILILPGVLRLLHAEKARDLALIHWNVPGSQEPIYVIENIDIRRYYGELIGKLARSHWISVRELEMEFPTTIPAGPGVPSNWTIDPIKVACLLRCADASQVDHVRAPSFLWALLKPKGISNEHWAFQNKIGRASISGDALIIGSGSSFKAKEANAWWLAYDVALMVDKELRQVDMLLESTQRKYRFVGKRVMGVESSESFSKYVQTEGWHPIDASLKISNVSGIVRTLGGDHLYGSSQVIPIRELIQNAADAVRARRLLTDQNASFGKINVSLKTDHDKNFGASRSCVGSTSRTCLIGCRIQVQSTQVKV
ncbi:MAG: hypothetical protein COZ50_08300, partial [Zetaproteobacteria bacterium CG_4_10_14_3_um_filter_54_28]